MTNENGDLQDDISLSLTDISTEDQEPCESCGEDDCCKACGCGSEQGHICPVCGTGIDSEQGCKCCAGGRNHHRSQFRHTEAAHIGFGVALGALAATDLVLKAIAVRRALKRGDRGWVLPLAIFNTVGLLPGIYLASHAPAPRLGQAE